MSFPFRVFLAQPSRLLATCASASLVLVLIGCGGSGATTGEATTLEAGETSGSAAAGAGEIDGCPDLGDGLGELFGATVEGPINEADEGGGGPGAICRYEAPEADGGPDGARVVITFEGGTSLKELRELYPPPLEIIDRPDLGADAFEQRTPGNNGVYYAFPGSSGTVAVAVTLPGSLSSATETPSSEDLALAEDVLALVGEQGS